MTTPTSLVELSVLSDDTGITLTGLPTGPVPTLTLVCAGEVLVEVDVTDVSAPARIIATDPEAASVTLRDLLGSATVDALMTEVTDGGTRRTVPFHPTAMWGALARYATALWNLQWNPFPLPSSLATADRLIAARAALTVLAPGATSGARQALTSTATELARLQAQGRISSLALEAVAEVLDLFPTLTCAPPEDPNSGAADEEAVADLQTIADSRLAAPTAALAADTPFVAAGEKITSWTASPDWRLTGIGVLSTAEDILHMEPLGDSPLTVVITAPVQQSVPPATRDQAPHYQAIITDPTAGTTIGYTHLHLNETGTGFEGTAVLSRPLQVTDVLDVRHPQVNAVVETNLSRRDLDRVHRCAARAFSLHRLLAASPREHDYYLWRTLARAWATTGEAITATTTNMGAPQGWGATTDAYQHLALSRSTQRRDQVAAKQITEKFADQPVPALGRRPIASPTLAEMDAAGSLVLPRHRSMVLA